VSRARRTVNKFQPIKKTKNLNGNLKCDVTVYFAV